jgi:hypothetical protein
MSQARDCGRQLHAGEAAHDKATHEGEAVFGGGDVEPSDSRKLLLFVPYA